MTTKRYLMVAMATICIEGVQAAESGDDALSTLTKRLEDLADFQGFSIEINEISATKMDEEEEVDQLHKCTECGDEFTEDWTSELDEMCIACYDKLPTRDEMDRDAAEPRSVSREYQYRGRRF